MNEKRVQVLLYTKYLHIIGGIETFVFNFIDLMSEKYNIGLYCASLPGEIATKLSRKIPLYKKGEIECETLVMIRAGDAIPEDIIYKKSVRMCHSLKTDLSTSILDDCDKIIHVSEASKASFKSKGSVIHNPLIKDNKKALLLVSATRIPAKDKGKNAERMLMLANKLNISGIPYLWFNFSDQPLKNAPIGFVNVGTFQEIQPYIAKADYLVQLSDNEGFGYSVLEALTQETAVICTPFETINELGVKDGENGYIVPFNLDFDVEKLLKVPKFSYEYDNLDIIKKWTAIFGTPDTFTRYKPPKTMIVEVLRDYTDIVLDKLLYKSEIVEMSTERAYYLEDKRLVKVIEGGADE